MLPVGEIVLLPLLAVRYIYTRASTRYEVVWGEKIFFPPSLCI